MSTNTPTPSAMAERIEALMADVKSGPWMHYTPKPEDEDYLVASLALKFIEFAPHLIAALRESERMREALEKIGEHDVQRPVGEPWAKDGKPSKHDKCTHGIWMWADCDNCIAEFARTALTPPSR